MQTKFLRKKLRVMDHGDDFDFDMDKMIQKWIIKNSLMEKMISGFDFSFPEIGQIVNATYIGLQGDYHLFESVFKDYIRVENRSNETKYLKNTAIGDKIDIVIVEIRDKDFIIKGSISALYETKAHQTLLNIEEDEYVTAFIREITPAGYNVDIFYEGVTLPGFMPNTLAGINKLYDVESILNKNLEVVIESYSNEEGTYIVSRRKYLQTLIKEETEKLTRNVVYTGNVTGTTAFGVFVEFHECLTGMIHKTNLNSSFQNQIENITPGTTIEFYVKEIISANPFDKIILTQTLKESLWDTIKVSQTLFGKVREQKQFGLLIQLDDETMGLLPASEVEKMRNIPSKDESIEVKISRILRQNRKIFLTLP